MQFSATYQCVIATDGEASFAVFLYDDPQVIVDATAGSVMNHAGFSAGIVAEFFPSVNTELDQLQSMYAFRIDGE